MRVVKVEQLSRVNDDAKWLTGRDIEDCLRSDNFIGPGVELKITEIGVDADDKKEEEIYKHLTEKIKEETDPDRCHSWCCALDRFCDTIRTRAGG